MKRAFLLLAAAVLLSGCMKPYDTPVFVNIGNSEEGFLIKVEGDSKQATTKSMEYLKENRVQSKRIQIPYRWQDMGRGINNGKYMPEAQLIIVDRQPCTREWTAEAHSGSAAKDQAIWVESSDSVGFSTGITIVARIQTEEDAVKFLFNYPANKERVIKGVNGKDDYVVRTVGIEDVMDNEVRAVIQRTLSEEASKYTMDEGRTKKTEMMQKVRETADKYFMERGITITSIGMRGGLTYQNPDIQKSIDKVFQAQQDKNVAKAEFEAATERKKALQAKGEGEAAIKIAAAEGEAKAIQKVSEAIQQMQNSPIYLALKQIEVQKQMFESWNGVMPFYLMGGGGEGQGPFGVLVQSPAIDASKIPASEPKPKKADKPAEAVPAPAPAPKK